MGLTHGYVMPSLDVNLNGNNSLITISWSDMNGQTPDQYQIKVDGVLQFTTANKTINNLTITTGADRTLVVDAYKAGTVVYSITKKIRFFDYTGSSQSWQVPINLSKAVLADVLGAQGGGSGGLGGRNKCYVKFIPGSTVYMMCGGAGSASASFSCVLSDPGVLPGGFNGGGTGGKRSDSYGCASGVSYTQGASGGGASDIRTINGDLSTRIVVAGGGGGRYGSSGGDGGGINGNDGGYSIGGSWPTTLRGNGGTSSAGGKGGTGGSVQGNIGVLGIGGSGAAISVYGDNPGAAGGGGGGYFGGGGGAVGSNYGAAGGGGGGSGYIDTTVAGISSKNNARTSGYNTGNGKILLSWFE